MIIEVIYLEFGLVGALSLVMLILFMQSAGSGGLGPGGGGNPGLNQINPDPQNKLIIITVAVLSALVAVGVMITVIGCKSLTGLTYSYCKLRRL